MSIIIGDCLDVMKTFPDNYFSGIVTDPPYGLSFMGKKWDYEVPKKSYWQEAIRISKPGSLLLSMGGSRTFHRSACEIEDAGWEIRDTLMWIYGSGFPKSHNNFGIQGFGTALKPAYEPIIMAMKPLDGTFKQNAEKWGVGGLNIDGCRIGSEEITTHGGNRASTENYRMTKEVGSVHRGRWPANLILDEEVGTMLNEQTGVLKSGCHKGLLEGKSVNEVYGKRANRNINPFEENSGGASRFFYCAKASRSERNKGLDDLTDQQQTTYNEMKGTESHSPNRCRSVKNSHPCVKPLALMRYLITLISPPTNAIILDPFAGSGSTLVAAKQLGIEAIGIEKSEEYSKIARARIVSAAKLDSHPDLFD